ncbi:type II secretion system minor pseudopilin GspI [Bacterioplanoides sp. SCSIO 12839]|uniref:type II secretion system minor pseudopilin GspI n=1 Tax=Bacterioplanoides sp. SCSIO 12839 TaxID=2829569 RepID=UPI002107E37D|nr:type II secretion system minor pseudopilin GspI [Bacterioplanoides sp. SCSIO 12839]UTW46752.1 type II secretion system minor pseudopilin GspI [Bacterioplanoides sp. SCSIO 12839]
MMRSQSIQSPGKQGGFTLLEVMIAVTIFAVIATTISQTTSQSVGNLLYLQDKTLAAFVAENQLAEIRLAPFPNVSDSNDVIDMAGREWRVNTKIENTQLPDTRRVTVSVADLNDKESNLATLATIVGKY